MDILNKTTLLCLSSIISLQSFQYAANTNTHFIGATCASIMTTGGDDRIFIKATEQRNKFLTSPVPEDSETIVRSSSTSCSSSSIGFAAAQKIFETLKKNPSNASFSDVAQSIRNRIRQYWGTNDCSIILSPSGTDAEFIPSLAALARHPEWGSNTKKKLVTNIVVANGEVGSGTTLAAGMRHFSITTPQSSTVSSGNMLSGISEEMIDVIGIKVRNDFGIIIPAKEVEEKIAKILHQAIDIDHGIAVLHMTHVSKTGLSGPTENFIAEMKDKYNDSLLIVVDAAHLRFTQETSTRWLNNGYWILITGSKFIGGASFSGALLIPQKDATLLAKISSNTIPKGLGDYFSPDDVDPLFASIAESLPKWHNTGLLLRWESALANAKIFLQTNPTSQARAISIWAKGVRSLIRSASNLTLCDDLVGCTNYENFNSCIGECNSVVSFGIRVNIDGNDRYLSTNELRIAYKFLSQDLRTLLPCLSEEENYIASIPCIIGQPVQIANQGKCTAMLRIAIGIPQIIGAIKQERLDPAVLVDEILEDDRIIINKLDLIAKHWAALF